MLGEAEVPFRSAVVLLELVLSVARLMTRGSRPARGSSARQSLSILGNTQKAATAEHKNQDGPLALMEMEETRRRDG